MSEEAHFFVGFSTSCAERAVKKSFPAQKNMLEKSHPESFDFTWSGRGARVKRTDYLH
ncbi:hypothetical protein [Ralstonia sp. 1138]|uniref:hypothetical protein n=1 Tax=Ralstonia sp. 1138 TaxID=3156423 RepID=UPI00339B82B7